MFIRRTDAEADNPIVWPPDVKNWLIGKGPDAGKDWRWEEKGMTGWDGWMTSLTQWTWVWVSSGSWWWTGRPGVLQSMGSQRVRHDWVTEMNWTKLISSGEYEIYEGHILISYLWKFSWVHQKEKKIQNSLDILENEIDIVYYILRDILTTTCNTAILEVFIKLILETLNESYRSLIVLRGLCANSDDKESACNAGDLGLIPA